jgi:hypothetical protein
MSRNINLLDRINIPAPCDADWDSMRGNDQVRFCSQCNLNVHNLSAMTRKEARQLVAASGGKLCVRYYKKPGGRIQTVASEQLHDIKRRVSKIAAGAFTAALSLSASVVAAQTPSQGDVSASNRAEASLLIRELSSEKQDDATSSMAGTIVDAQGAYIPNARVTLTKDQGEQERRATTDKDGKFEFQYLETGLYNIKVEADGFAAQEITNMLVQSGGEPALPIAEVEIQLPISSEMDGTVSGGAMIMLPENPLVKAAFENNLEAVRMLLSQGAEVNVIDKDVDTSPLAEAVSQGNLEMVRALLAAGADVNKKNRSGHTPLMNLDEDATPEIVLALVSAGAKVNAKDEEGMTALMNATSADNAAVVQALIDSGAKVDAKDHDGETALMCAAQHGNINALKVLATSGANLNLRNEDGETALKLARDNEEPEIVKLLESYGAIE